MSFKYSELCLLSISLGVELRQFNDAYGAVFVPKIVFLVIFHSGDPHWSISVLVHG